jgi:hypothetical protein
MPPVLVLLLLVTALSAPFCFGCVSASICSRIFGAHYLPYLCACANRPKFLQELLNIARPLCLFRASPPAVVLGVAFAAQSLSSYR